MKTERLKFIGLSVLAGAFLAACGGLGKMEKKIEELGASASPDPLEVRGDMVEVTISGKFPEKYFQKKVIAEATPVLVYEGGETAFEMKGYQGEDAVGNYEVIPYATGKDFSYTASVPYEEAMMYSNLELRIKGSKGTKSAEFDPIPVALGVVTTPYLMKNDDMPAMGQDNFKRILSFSKNGEINYAYNSASINSRELRDEDYKMMKDFIKNSVEDETISITGMTSEGYASPEGELSLNADLAQNRAENASKAIMKEMKRAKIEAPEGFFNNVEKGEDWNGFKSLMEESSIEDKDLILRVLTMYSDLQEREQEIKNLAKTYREVEKEILPKLRRAQMTLNYDLVGYSDDELKTLSMSSPDSLTVEELLYAGGLYEDLNDKAKIYQSAERVYGNDYRTVTNVGYVAMMQNDVATAKAKFEKAFEVEENDVTKNNMGIVERLNGNRDAAMELFSASSSAEAKYNKGLVQIQTGDYSSAVSNMSGQNTVNAALAKLLSGDGNGALTTLDNANDTSATADYVRAVINARQNNQEGVVSNLNSAMEKDPSMRDRAKKDREFEAYKNALNF